MAAFEIRDLSFTYPNETAPALRHIRMDIPEGKITLICGASGELRLSPIRGVRQPGVEGAEQSAFASRYGTAPCLVGNLSCPFRLLNFRRH